MKISEKKWVIPELSENSEINIKQGFHPVLGNNKLEGDYENNFYPNDTLLTSNKNMMLLTGPNMSGKSTYMKQVALITILGRMGAPVPASYAKIGVIDRIFTRIGAADDLAGGRSTFMVEMTEAAKILHKSTKKSLVIMDEIGRGTSTSDGLALAIAIATEINKVNQSLCLFATHYFEITELSKQLKGVENFHISTKERDDQIVFLYELKKGPASKSFGLKVAKLAGIPNSVLNYANSIKLPTNHEILVETEQEISKNILEQNKGMEIINEIVNIDPNVCSPKLALDLIFKWKKSLDS
ncbi:MAG: hypothetical protein CBD16_08445 [Betaproteobacteria bacterium TMED156]|nr:MAG: hypothetical protein CBD16_08445 [Betaproteobacteria bacterium TMED156]